MSKSKALIPIEHSTLAVPVGNIESYMSWTYQLPLLSKEEEELLARRFQENNDLAAARELVLSQLRYVVKIARGYLGYGLPLADLIQEGNIGLMKSVKRFDPNMGVRLVTFAVYWIKSEIHEYVIKNWRIVKIATTKAQRKLFFNLRSYKKQVGSWFTQEEIKAIAKDLDVPEAEVLRMEQRIHSNDTAFDSPIDNDEDKAYLMPAAYLEDASGDPAHVIEQDSLQARQQLRLHEALESLDDRGRAILEARWLNQDKATLHDLAKQFNVSAERIRQLEQNALKKLKSLLADLDENAQ